MVNGFFSSLLNWEKFAGEHGQYFLIAAARAPVTIAQAAEKTNLSPLARVSLSTWRGWLGRAGRD
jgi:hypothetical protein